MCLSAANSLQAHVQALMGLRPNLAVSQPSQQQHSKSSYQHAYSQQSSRSGGGGGASLTGGAAGGNRGTANSSGTSHALVSIALFAHFTAKL